MLRSCRSARIVARRALPALVAATVLHAAGCLGSSGPDACELIADKTFASLNQMECGRGADGAITYCNWRVSFTHGTYSWAHSDVVETGTYSCDGATIFTTRGVASMTPLLGRLDLETGRLTWDASTYVIQ
jgi:hypothetical protein